MYFAYALLITALCFAVLGAVAWWAVVSGGLQGVSVLWAYPIALFVCVPALITGAYLAYLVIGPK